MLPTKDLRRLIINDGQTVRDAMRAITDNWREVALVENSLGCIVGLITDGDIRRGLLRGETMDSPATRVMTSHYLSVGPSESRAAVLDLMKARTIRHIPVIDGNLKLLGVHFLEDLLGAYEKPNAAVIMAGGEGTRLRPLTENCPKPMMLVAGRPILERIVLHLVGYGIRRILISVNYLAHIIEDYFGDGSRFGCSIEYLHESRPLGTGGALSLLSEPEQHPLIVMNGDLVSQFNLARLLEFHRQEAAVATLAARNYQVEIPFGVISEDNKRFLSLAEKPSTHYLINAGIYVLNPRRWRSFRMTPSIPSPTCSAPCGPTADASQSTRWMMTGLMSGYPPNCAEPTAKFEFYKKALLGILTILAAKSSATPRSMRGQS